MPEAPRHPSSQALSLFGNGKLAGAQAAAVAAHLETCASCRSTVAGLADDSVLGQLGIVDPYATVGATNSAPSPGPGMVRAAPVLSLPPELASHPKFRIVRELGRGGMGVVYLAEHRVMEKAVALKVITPAALDNADAVARFLAEARAAGKLDHPNIARALDADQAGNLHFLVLEFVEGRTLGQILEQKGALPVSHACHFVRQAALGLQHAADCGMAHRDIKPSNLMVTPRGQVKILDFGLARLRTQLQQGPRLTQTHSFMGTPEYVSPEQATDARQADVRSDIYSLGCTLFAALTGRPPFVANTVIKLILARVESEAPLLRSVNPDLSAGLEAIVARMLAKDPERRYQHPNEVALVLTPFLKVSNKGATAIAPAAASPDTGTVMGGNTKRLEEPASKKPPSVERLVAEPRRAKTEFARRARPRRKPRARSKYPLLAAGIAAAAVALSLLAVLMYGLGGKRAGTATNAAADSKLLVAEDSKLLVVDLGDGLKLELVRIDPGQFMMGAPQSEKLAYDDEKPRHAVRITKPFYLGKYPVTQEQYERLTGDNPSSFAAKGYSKEKVEGLDTRQFPVESVAWEDADAYCSKLTARTLKQLPETLVRQGYMFRLPTEAQWEYACRAGTVGPFCFGEMLNGEQANCNGNFPYGTRVKGPSLERTTKVGNYPANAWGLYDMHGNVFQWCQDHWKGDYYATSPVDDPLNTVEDQFGRRVTRGGSHNVSPFWCRSAFRRPLQVSLRYDSQGFRVAFRGD